MSNKNTYVFQNTYFIDGHEDCPCCSGLRFDTYQLVSVNGLTKDSMYEYQCSWEEDCCKIALQYYHGVSSDEYPYEGFKVEWVKEVCKDYGIEIIVEAQVQDE